MKLTSLRSRLVIIVGLVVFIFGTLATLFVYEYSHRRFLKQGQENQEKTVLFQAREITNNFIHYRQIVEQLANRSEIKQQLSQPKENNQEATDILTSFIIPEQFLAIYLMDRSGLTTVSTDPRMLKQNYSFRQYFQKSILGQSYFDIAIGVTTKELGFYLSQPAYNQKEEIAGVLVAKIKPTIPNLSGLVQKDKNSKTKFIITDEYGIILQATNQNLLFQTIKPLSVKEKEIVQIRYPKINFKPSLYHRLDLDLKKINSVQSQEIYDQTNRKNKLISLTKVNNSPFYLLIEEETNVYAKEAFNVAFLISAFVLLAAISSVLVMNYLINWLLKPLAVLHEAVINLAQGDFSQRVRLQTGDEVEDLGNSFNKMVEAVIKSREEIDHKVKQQTQEIIEKSQKLEKQQIATLNVLEDVEKEQQLSSQQAQDLKKYLLAIENVSEHIVITDNDGYVLYANPAVEKITGFSRKEILHKKAGVKKLWGGLMGKPFYEKLWRTIKTEKKPFSGEVRNKRKNGENYTAFASISPIIEDGKVAFFVGIERDITKAKEVDRMKTEFISLASHQLRTPLSAMKWFLEMLLKGDAGKLNPEQIEMVSNIDQSNERMIELVNSLLNISRIESGRIIIDPQPTDLSKLTEELLIELNNKLKEKKHHLITEVDSKLPKANLDPKLIRNALLNLLTNAIKYTPTKGKIKLAIKRSGQEIIIIVQDNGYGIPKKEQDKVFNKLYRGTNVIKFETDGNGLGLYLVKNIIEASDGQISFISQENKGTTFTINLPLKGVKPKKGEVTLDS